ncbi:hydrophobe/amphiphile efflux-1 (HAE1) family protein [Bradyrhizobium sp. GM6.1]
MISKFFIERPVLSNVIALLMILIGGVALFNLAIAQYPDVVPPTVQVTTRYPGASAKTVIDTVALPIEQQVNGVEDMLYMQSYSGSDGTYTLTVTFKIGTDLNFAQVLVQNRVSSALSQLPQSVQNQGVTVQKRSTSILLFVTLTSPDKTFDSLYLSNYATINLRDELSRLPGVGNVTVFGAGQYSMRVWLDPNKLQVRGLVPQDVIQAIQQQSQQVSAGQVGAPPTPPGQAFQYTLNVNGRLDDTTEFENIIVKSGTSGDVTRVRDVGWVELGAQTYSQIFSLNKQPATGIGVFQSPGANALQVEQAVEKKMAQLAKAFPQGMKYDTPFDTTKFVQASVHEVYMTLIEAGLLVLVVILVFLQDWRAMLVPATTVPVTIIGAFAAMAALGFTINMSTLFAIVLAIGIVVDDAIVVVEGAAHNIEQGMNGHDAAIKAMDQLFAPIVGITLVLIFGVFASVVPRRAHRPHLFAICAGDRGDRASVRHQRGDAEADAMRSLAAADGAAGAAQLLLSRLQRGLQPRRARLHPTDRRAVQEQHDLGRDRAGADRDRRLRAVPGTDRLPADRGPGLPDRRRATA